jgi:hypothetical protein
MSRFTRPQDPPVRSVRAKLAVRKQRSGGEAKEVPLQVMVSEPIRKQVAILSAERGENIRTTVLRGLKAIGVRVPEHELADRRGRRAKE